MIKEVVKRDGRVVPFDECKIRTAVQKAMNEVNYPHLGMADCVVYPIRDLEKETMSVEDIQDEVEKLLIQCKLVDVAKAYIRYRYDHEKTRNFDSEIYKKVHEKLGCENVENQNANVDERSFGGRSGEVTRAVLKQYALDKCMSNMSRNNHLNNEIYIHDLDSYALGMHNCADGKSWVAVKRGDNIQSVRLEDLGREIGLHDGKIASVEQANYQILSRDGWTKLNKITKRKVNKGEKIYTIKTRTGLPLRLTGDHRLPIIRGGEEKILPVKDIAVGDKLISVDKGVLSMKEIQTSFLNLIGLDDGDLDLRIFNLSPLKSYLRFKYGIQFEVYANKYFSYYRGSSQRGIKVKDFVKLIDDYPVSYEVLSQLKIASNNSKHKYPLLVPYSKELAKIYAYVYSDGSVYVNNDLSIFHLTFTNTNEEMIDDFIYCFESCFGKKLNKCYPTPEYAANNSPCIRVTCSDRVMVKLFKDFAGGLMNGSGDLSIPDFVMNGSKEIKYAYLSAAIDCDECLCSHNINISSACKSYCEQLVLLLNSLGYHPCLVLTDKAGSKYHFSKSNRTGIRNFDGYSVSLRRNDEQAELYSKMSTVKQMDCYAYKGISGNFVENKITSIVTTEEDISVYDLETADHWFILNDYVSHNCLSMPIDDLLANGFKTRQTDVRPANSISTAMQLVAVLFQIQSLQQFGGVSATHIDHSMVPYVRKSFLKHFKDGMKWIHGVDFELDKDPKELSIEDDLYKNEDTIRAYDYALAMTEKETHQAVEGLFHNLNIGATQQ